MWIDSHCHLNHNRLLHLGGAAKVAERAGNAGINGILNICCRINDEFPQILETSRELDNVWCSIGTHPHDASSENEKTITLEKLMEMAQSDPKIVGIGETGLDYYYKHSSKEDQHDNFRKHLRACVKTGLPVIVHSRDAEEDTINIIREEGQGGKLTGVMHCFSSEKILAEAALELGFYVSFSGILTFKKSEELHEIAKEIPLAYLLVETDAPFLAPEPHRKEVNEPALVVHTGKVLAEIKGISEEKIATITKQNFFALFDKAGETYKA
jgi:TatD DNase family protein